MQEYDPELWRWLLSCLREALTDLILTMNAIVAALWLACFLL